MLPAMFNPMWRTLVGKCVTCKVFLSLNKISSRIMSTTKTNVIKRIGTHNGVFHCDEVLACFLLKRLPEFTAAEIIRTRDASILDTCDVVVDVGSVYDPEKHRYDHHQSTFTHTMNSLDPNLPWKIKLSSAGLVYYHFGERILEAMLGLPVDPNLIKKLYYHIYENFIQEIDGIDNGVPMFDGEPKYRINTNLSARIHGLNPFWNDEGPHDSQKLFHTAMDLVGREFIDQIHYFTKSWWPARAVVEKAIENRNSVNDRGEIIELEKSCPWKKHLFEIENEKGISGSIKFVIYKDDSWRVQGVPVEPDSFICRVFLKEDWRGQRDQNLDSISGINGCVFVHSSGFIGGNKTREGAIEMALQTLNSFHNSVSQ